MTSYGVKDKVNWNLKSRKLNKGNAKTYYIFHNMKVILTE